MENEVKQIEEDLQKTKESLARNLRAVEQVVDDTKDRVMDKVQNIKDSVNLRAQTEKHPVGFLLGSVAVGFLVGVRLMTRNRVPLFSRFHNEIEVAKGIVVGVLAKKLGEKISDSFTDWGTNRTVESR